MAELVETVAGAIVDAGLDVRKEARAAIRATLEAAIERVTPKGTPASTDLMGRGWHSGRMDAANVLLVMLAALDG